MDAALAARILAAAQGTPIECVVALAMATGMWRGEILALGWSGVDDDYSAARVRRALQPTASGLVFAEPKLRPSRRSVALPRFLAPYLERQRADQLARRAPPGGWSLESPEV